MSNEVGQAHVANYSFSAKPAETGAYPDYYEKVSTYVALISGQAQALDPAATAYTFPVIESGEEHPVFKYEDTASSRAGIGAVNDKLKVDRVAIVGLGGSGSYLLDFIAKTPAKEIHIIDGDVFLQHNAFRSPGAATPDELEAKQSKVAHYAAVYSHMHNGIIAHNCYLDQGNLNLLDGMKFVFICLDNGAAKKPIVQLLEDKGMPFVDVGMGVSLVDDSLIGVLRVTTGTPGHYKHIHEDNRISFAAPGPDDEYNQNIQIAELNALNASLAIIKYKKTLGFYLDLESEHFSTYTIDGNAMTNEENADTADNS